MKKAQGLSMNTIIIAALALLVLAVIAMVFMSRTNIFVNESSTCASKGGVCRGDCDDHDGLVKSNLPNTNCENDDECCIAGERANTETEGS